MTIASGERAPRRQRPQGPAAERYRAYARQAGRRHSRARSLFTTLAASAVLSVVGLLVLARIGDAMGAGLSSLTRDVAASVAEAFPSLGGSIGITERNVGEAQAAPVVDGLPAFTAQEQVLLQAHVPGFALAPGRQIEVALNGTVLGASNTDANGKLAAPLTLRDGANTIVLTLLDQGRAIASTSATIVLDKTAPPLSLSRPAGGALVEGSTVTVEGKTEPGAHVVINGRIVVTAPDGTFSDTFAAAAGSLALIVSSTDRAGNETLEKLQVTVRPPAVASAGISLTLDRTRVRPGETVVAEMVFAPPRTDVVVTLQVGVITIGSVRTDATGRARIGFAAPTTEGDIGIVALGDTASARATLTVAR